MNKLNKKGFTLIEMLVVIAIIAVLVAIIIPTISSATTKASAAANAANLRAWKAELTTGYLSATVTAAEGAAPVAAKGSTLPTAPTSKKCGPVGEGVVATATFTNGEFVCIFGTGNTIAKFASVAEDGKTDGVLTAATKAPKSLA